MPRLAPLAVWIVLPCLGATLHAQGVQPSTDNADVLVLDHDFATGGEIVRVFMQDLQVYRAELSSQDVTLEIRPPFSGGKPLRVYPVADAGTASGSSVVEIYPDADGDYEIRPISIQGSRVSTHLRLYRDGSESRRRVAMAGKAGWELGVELGGAWHSGFVQSNAAPPLGAEPSGGMDIEGCLSARRTGTMPRFGMCVLGVSHQSQPGAPGVLWLFTEPRLGAMRWGEPGLSGWESGLLFRFGLGISAASPTPKMFAPGAFLARHIRKTRNGTGWTLQLSYSWAWFKGFSNTAGISDPVTPKSHRVSFGVGWYQ